MKPPDRKFEDSVAARVRVPLMIGLFGPSGGGKTYSALRLATGIQRVTGGDIFMVDTEARRGLHYADYFRYRHVPFEAPFGPLDYLASIEHCASRGARVVIVDSMSHEHEGPGGVLEQHEAEVERLSRGNADKIDKIKMLAWVKPKQQRRRLINTLLQLPVSAIFCFRAKDKIKPVSGGDPLKLGWMPIAGEEFLFEMTVNCLLLPKADGVPTWESEHVGEREVMKQPRQFKELFAERAPLSENIGEALARWAEGGPGQVAREILEAIAAADLVDLEAIAPRVEEAKKARTISQPELRQIKTAYAARRDELRAAAPNEAAGRQPGED